MSLPDSTGVNWIEKSLSPLNETLLKKSKSIVTDFNKDNVLTISLPADVSVLSAPRELIGCPCIGTTPPDDCCFLLEEYQAYIKMAAKIIAIVIKNFNLFCMLFLPIN